MPEVAQEVWRDPLMGMWVFGSGRVDQSVHSPPDLHIHGPYCHPFATNNRELPGYFLNFTPSGDGTVFKGSDNNYWYGKGGSYNLHITGGHEEVDTPEHGAPDKFMSTIAGEMRGTGVLQIYPKTLDI